MWAGLKQLHLIGCTGSSETYLNHGSLRYKQQDKDGGQKLIDKPTNHSANNTAWEIIHFFICFCAINNPTLFGFRIMSLDAQEKRSREQRCFKDRNRTLCLFWNARFKKKKKIKFWCIKPKSHPQKHTLLQLNTSHCGINLHLGFHFTLSRVCCFYLLSCQTLTAYWSGRFTR